MSDVEVVRVEYDTIPGDEVTDKMLGDYCKLDSVYISHRWGGMDAKMTRQRYSRRSPWNYAVYFQSRDGHANISFQRDNIEEIVFIRGQTIPYYIKLKKG